MPIVTWNKIQPWNDKTNKMSVCPAKTQISLGIHPICSESSLCAQWVAKDPRFLHADSQDSDQTGRMPRLIWVFAERTLILLLLSCPGSNYFKISKTYIMHTLILLSSCLEYFCIAIESSSFLADSSSQASRACWSQFIWDFISSSFWVCLKMLFWKEKEEH